MARFLDADLLRRVRTELGLTQEGAAERLGVDARSYRRYETGAVNDPVEGFVVRHASRRRLVERLCAEFGLAEADLLVERPARAQDRAPGARAWRPRRVHPLPPARHFVGRASLLADLRRWRDEPAPSDRVLAVVAVGGAGKTSLVERLLADVVDAPGPAGLLVWSFYEDPRVDAFLREASLYFGEDADRPTLERLHEALAAGPPHLLALDGVEVLQADGRGARARGELEDPGLRRLLRALAAGAGGARAVVTSRFELLDLSPWEGAGASTLRLDELTSDEAAELLGRWGVAGAPDERARLATRLGGHALSVAVAGSYAGGFLGGDPARLGDLDLDRAAEDDPLARRLAAMISRYAADLAPLERDLMARVAAFPGGATPEAIAALAAAGGPAAGALEGADAASLARALARLERLGLLTRGAEGVAVHPFVRERFVGLLGEGAAAVQEVERRRLAGGLTEQPDAHAQGESAWFDRVEALLEATLRAGLPREGFELYRRGLGGFSHLGLRRGEMLRGLRVTRGFAAGDDPAALDPRLPADVRAGLAYDWGLYAGALGDLAQAERCYAAHERLVLEALGPARGAPELVTSLRTRAYVARLRGALQEARALIDRSVDAARAAGLERHLVRGLALAASVRHDLGDVEGAAGRFAQVRSLEAQPEARRALWEAEHHLALGRLVEATATSARVRAECEALGWHGHAAHASVLLALVALADPARADALEAAGEALEAARRWCDASGEVEMRLSLDLARARLHLALGATSAATSTARQARTLAEGGGFAPFADRLALVEAEAALARDDPRRALDLAAAALHAAAERGDAWVAADAAHHAGVAALRAGDPERGRVTLVRALEARRALGHPEVEATQAALARA